MIKVFDNLSDTTPTVFADLLDECAQLLGPGAARAWRSTRTSRPSPTSTSSTRTTRRIGGTAPRGARPERRGPCPTPPGPDGRRLCGQRPAVAPHGTGNVMTGPEQVLDRGLVPAVSEPLDRLARVRRRRRALRDGRRRRELQLHRLRPGRLAAESLRRPAGGRRRDLTPPTAEGGALRSQDVRTPTDPTGLDGALLRVDPATGAALPDNPNAASADPNARRIIAYGLRNPFRITIRPGHERGLDRRRRLEHLGGDQPGRRSRPPRSRTSAGPATRAVGRQSGYDGVNLSHLREPLRRGHRRSRAAVLHATTTARRSSPARPARPGARRSPGLAFYHGRRRSRTVRRRALLRRLLARLHLGDVPAGRRAAEPGRRCATFVARRREPGRPAGRPRRRALLRRLRRRHDPPDRVLREPAAGRRADGDPDQRARPAPGLTSTARVPATPRAAPHLRVGSRRRRAVRRLERVAADVHLHPAGNVLGQAARFGSSERERYEPADHDYGEQHAADGDDHATGGRDDLGRRRLVHLLGTATDAQQGTLPGSALHWDIVMQHCPSNCHEHSIQSSTVSQAARSPRRTTSTRRTSSFGSRRRTPAV